MKRSIVVLSAAMALIVGSAVAQPRGEMHGQMPGRMQGQMQGHMSGGGRGPMMGLNLTDDQQTKMADLRLKFLKEIEPLKADLEKQHSALRLEMTAEKFNEARVKSIQSDIAKLQGDLGWKQSVHQRAVRDLLTPEQQKRFDAGMLSGGPGAGRPGRMQGMHRGMMPQGPGMGQHKCDDCPKNK